MKLRVRGNSIRFRVSRSELDRLVWTGVVEDAVQFGPGRDQRMTYALRRDNHASAVSVDYTPGRILVLIPPAMINRWQNPDQVGISGVHDIGAGEPLSILLEKDFACSERAGAEDDADTFPRSEAAGRL
jgi:hypothetical protein